jgi:soluble lytic murein transglycosylase
LARAATPDEAISDERLSQLGMALYHARDNPAAVATFRQLLERAPRGQLAPAALFMLARLHLRVEADDLFLATEKTLTTQFPGSKQAEEARYLVGHFHRNRGRTAEAKRVFQQVAQQGKGGEFADNAMWYLGWMQYGAGEHAQAAATWGKLLTTVPGSPLVPDALYWLGRALERLGRQGDARARFERLRASYGQTYYGYLAAARLSGSSAWAWDARGSEGPVTDLTGRIANAALQDPPSPGAANPHAVRGAELWAMRLWAEAGEELQAVPTEQGKALSSQWRAAQAFHWAGDHHRAMAIVRRYGKGALQQAVGISPEDLQEMTFPLGALQRLHGASLAGLDPLFVGALVMAESHWNPHALSPVGARGLMQLMPDTGRRVAQGIGVGLASDDQLFDALLNLRLGISHLRELLLRFDQLLPLAAASYNAGEEEVAKWWARRGEMDIEEFVANIPFRETRQYVQRVFVFYTTYQRIYRGLPG